MYRNSEERKLFWGTEVEKTVHYGKRTLFVAGVYTKSDIIEAAQLKNCSHIFLAANQSFAAQGTEQWIAQVNGLVQEGYAVTLDVPVQYADQAYNWPSTPLFVLMLNFRLPYIEDLPTQTVIKVDDNVGCCSNPGVWCIDLVQLKHKAKFTPWAHYSSDEDL